MEQLTVRPGSGVCSTLQVLLEPGGLAHGWGDKPLVNGAVNGRWMEREWGVQLFPGSGEWSYQKFPKHNDTRCFVLATRI